MTEIVTPAAETITQLFARAVEQWPDKVAFRVKRGEEWDPITFAEYGEHVRACAGGLGPCGGGEEARDEGDMQDRKAGHGSGSLGKQKRRTAG